MSTQNNNTGNNGNNRDQQAQNNGGQNNEGMSNTIKNPDDWKTGDEPMTGAQRSYLNTLSDEAGQELDADLSKAEASKKIDELQQVTGRGQNNNNNNG